MRGVLSMNCSHQNRDILVPSFAATLAGWSCASPTCALGGDLRGLGGRDDEEGAGAAFGLVVTAVLGSLAAMLIQLAISRSREYWPTKRAGFAPPNPGREPSRNCTWPHSGFPGGRSAGNRPPVHRQSLTGRSLANLFSTQPPIGGAHRACVAVARWYHRRGKA